MFLFFLLFLLDFSRRENLLDLILKDKIVWEPVIRSNLLLGVHLTVFPNLKPEEISLDNGRRNGQQNMVVSSPLRKHGLMQRADEKKGKSTGLYLTRPPSHSRTGSLWVSAWCLFITSSTFTSFPHTSDHLRNFTLSNGQHILMAFVPLNNCPSTLCK